MSELTIERAREVLQTRFGGVLKNGKHTENGECCVRELTSVLLGLPWSDHPDAGYASPTDRACQRLNDARWSSDAVRTEHCLPLALLRESWAAPQWWKGYALKTIQRIIPIALRAAAKAAPKHAEALEVAAVGCEAATDLASARAAAAKGKSAASAASAAAAASSAAYAADAYAAAADAAASAADAAADAAYAAADAAYAAATRDEVLALAVRILIEAHGGK